MLKIFPIIIIPLFFIIIFLGVENLTQNNLNIVEVEEEKINNEKEKISEKTNIELANVEELKEPTEQKKKLFDQPKKNEFEKVKNTEINSTKTDSKKKKEKVIKKEKGPNLSKIDQVVLQFGAFSRKDYAQNQKKDIERKIKNKFPEIKISVDYESDRKLYKLIYEAKDKSLAKSICKFSEKIKINCLIKNK
tara:strand:- start:1335 stop:1910 length:576 start_codon:yes stop_codon:yes gene_type:complete